MNLGDANKSGSPVWTSKTATFFQTMLLVGLLSLLCCPRGKHEFLPRFNTNDWCLSYKTHCMTEYQRPFYCWICCCKDDRWFPVNIVVCPLLTRFCCWLLWWSWLLLLLIADLLNGCVYRIVFRQDHPVRTYLGLGTLYGTFGGSMAASRNGSTPNGSSACELSCRALLGCHWIRKHRQRQRNVIRLWTKTNKQLTQTFLKVSWAERSDNETWVSLQLDNDYTKCVDTSVNARAFMVSI